MTSHDLNAQKENLREEFLGSPAEANREMQTLETPMSGRGQL